MPAPALMRLCRAAGLIPYQLDPETKQRRVAKEPKKRHSVAMITPDPVYVIGPHLNRAALELERWGEVADYERELWSE